MCEGYWLCAGGRRWVGFADKHNMVAGCSAVGHSVSCTAWVVAADCAGQDGGMTPLMGASEGGHVECVRLLLDRGAGVDDVSSCLVVCTYRGA